MTTTQSTESMELDSEEALILRAQRALSRCNWEIGECASQWTKKYAKGRGDADFGALIGLSGDQIYQRRRVWETFADVYQNYPNLKWSHFYVVLNWDDAAECLAWANEMEATIAEMKAWRRAQHGDDLSTPAPEEEGIGPLEYLTPAIGMVQDPSQFQPVGAISGGYDDAPFDEEGIVRAETALSAARESAAPAPYAPFGKGARGPAPGEERAPREELSPEQVLKKTVQMLERAVNALTPEVLESFSEMPISLQQRLLDAVENLQARTAGLA